MLGRRHTHTPQTRNKRIAFKRYKNEEIEVRRYVYSNSLKNVNYTPPQVVLSDTTQMVELHNKSAKNLISALLEKQ